MQFAIRAVFALVLCAQASSNPVSKVLELLADLTTKVTKERETAAQDAAKFQAMCKDTVQDLGYEIKEEQAQVESLTASIEDATATVSSATDKVEQLAASIANDESSVKKATEQRGKEQSDFEAAKKELDETIDMLKRAISILERHAGAAFLQQGVGTDGLIQALTAMVDASALSSDDASRLTALVQHNAAANTDDEDEDLGAPAAAVYQSKSGSIVDTLEDLLDKAEEQRREEQKTENNAKHNFAMSKQALEASIKNANENMAEQREIQATATEKKANDEGDHAATAKDLAADEAKLAKMKVSCENAAATAAADDKARADELAALAGATKAVQEATGGATDIVYGSASFVQLRSGSNIGAVVKLLRDLAKKHHVPALTQLATRVASVSRARGDVFAKVKSLISNMIEKLNAEQAEEADEKQFCDSETAKNEAAKEEKTSDAAKLTTKIDSKTAKSEKLNEEVATLQKDLAKLAKSQMEMDKLRKEQNEQYVSEKKDLDQGIEGVEIALRALKDYYGGDGGGKSSGVIGMLEVIESDFSKQLAEIDGTESDAAVEYEKVTQANKIEKSTKEQDVKYKSKESASLAKKVSELTEDRSGVEKELSAVEEYLVKLADRCVAKPETYEERKAAREQEIAGLKQALKILQEETSLIQKKSSLRGLNRH